MEKKRVWEIDYLRVFAILLMVIYHTVYDLSEFAGWTVNFDEGFWFWYGKLAMIFPFVSGISCGFSRKSSWKSGIKLIFLGLGITGITYFVIPEDYVKFGVLHFLGIAMLLYPILRKINTWCLGILTLAIFVLTKPISSIETSIPLLIPFGFKYPHFSSADYFPLFPYLGVFIIGIIAFKLYYHKGRSLFPFDWGNKVITKISKRSLAIYILHQPILMAIILLFKWLGI